METFPIPPRPVIETSSVLGFYLLDTDALLAPDEEYPTNRSLWTIEQLRHLRAILNSIDI